MAAHPHWGYGGAMRRRTSRLSAFEIATTNPGLSPGGHRLVLPHADPRNPPRFYGPAGGTCEIDIAQEIRERRRALPRGSLELSRSARPLGWRPLDNDVAHVHPGNWVTDAALLPHRKAANLWTKGIQPRGWALLPNGDHVRVCDAYGMPLYWWGACCARLESHPSMDSERAPSPAQLTVCEGLSDRATALLDIGRASPTQIHADATAAGCVTLLRVSGINTRPDEELF